MVSSAASGSACPGSRTQATWLPSAAGLKQRDAGRIGAAAREPGEHVEQDSADGLVALGQGQVPRDPAHATFSRRLVPRVGTLLSMKILEWRESFKAVPRVGLGRDPVALSEPFASGACNSGLIASLAEIVHPAYRMRLWRLESCTG